MKLQSLAMMTISIELKVFVVLKFNRRIMIRKKKVKAIAQRLCRVV